MGLSQRVLERYPEFRSLEPTPKWLHKEWQDWEPPVRWATHDGEKLSVLRDDPELSYVMDRIDSLVAEMPTEKPQNGAWVAGGVFVFILGVVFLVVPLIISLLVR